MKVLIDINHPAHVHFFRNPAALLKKEGHQVLFTSRNKDVTLALLEQYGLQNTVLSEEGTGGMLSLGKELICRNYALYRVVKKEKPDVMASIGGTFISHVGAITRTPSIVFYDTENAKLQNLITYPLASCVVVPDAYQAWLPRKHCRYSGYHELSYLHPDYFAPDLNIAEKNGLDLNRENIFIRLVAWKANHDIGETGWTKELLSQVIHRYSSRFNILISSEQTLDQEFDPYLYRGNVAAIHHVLSFCRLFIGESATMASEAAVLGVPAIYAAETGRGYTDEQEKKYGIVRNIRLLEASVLMSTMDDFLREDPIKIKEKKENLLSNTIDVADYVKQFLVDWVLNRTEK